MPSAGHAKRHKSPVWWAIGLAVLVALVYLLNYVSDARMRRQLGPSCKWNIVTNPTNEVYDHRYSARFCLLPHETTLLRVYLDEHQLVAERTYSYPHLGHIYWATNGVFYANGGDHGGFIDIPPTLIDRLRAKLP